MASAERLVQDEQAGRSIGAIEHPARTLVHVSATSRISDNVSHPREQQRIEGRAPEHAIVHFAEEREHLGTLETRYAELLSADPLLESRPTFLFFKGAARFM